MGVKFKYKTLTKNISAIPWLNQEGRKELWKRLNIWQHRRRGNRVKFKRTERCPGRGGAGGRGSNGKATWCWRRVLNRTQGRSTISWAHWPEGSAFFYPKSQTNSLYFVCGIFFEERLRDAGAGRHIEMCTAILKKGRFSICNGYT
jgi:hypothetical protein